MFKKLTKKSVERKLQEVIDQYKVGDSLGIAKIKDWIFNDHGDSAIDASNRFQKRLFHYFKDVKDINEINEVFQAAVDAWNFYPHKSLGGKSPQQMMEQALKDNPDLRKKKDDKMPDIIVGGKKISWDKHWAMIKKMEQMQKPFRQQIEKDILPLYKRFLVQEKGLSEKAAEENRRIADTFFERVLWVGFLDYEMIRPEFAKHEFPRWWQTHILGDDHDENEIWSSLRILISFMKEKFNLEMQGKH